MAKKDIEDEEFERFLREFIDTELESDDTPEDTNTDNRCEAEEVELPFPKEMDDNVARIKLSANAWKTSLPSDWN